MSAAWRHKKISETRSPLAPDFIKGRAENGRHYGYIPYDFATKWEMEAFVRQDMKGFEAIKDQLVDLGMTDAKHGILFGQKINIEP